MYFVMIALLGGFLLFGALEKFVTSEFLQIEKDDVRIALTRAMETIRSDGQSLRAWARDIAPWDETYSFVETRDPAYITGSFPPESLENLELDLLMFIDTNDSVAWSYIDEQQSIDDLRYESLPRSDPSNAESDKGTVGLHRLNDDSVYLVVLHSILTSEYRGPSRGVAIFSRRLDNARFEHLIKSSVANFELLPIKSDALSAGLVKDIQSEATGMRIVRTNGETKAYAVLSDFNDEPVMILEVRTHKKVTANGFGATRSVMLAYAAFAFLAFMFFWIVLVRLSRNNEIG